MLIEKTIEIDAPANRVYDFLAEPSNLPRVWPSLVAVSNVMPAAAAPGSDFDWEFKMAGIHFKGHAKVEESQPAKLVRVHNEGGVPSTFVWKYEPIDDAHMRLHLDVEYAMPGKVFGRLAAGLVAKINEKDIEKLLGNLKREMERGAASVAH